MRISFLLLFALITFLSYGQNEDKINIPQGVVYKYCDKKIVEKTKQLIKDNIAKSNDYSLSQHALVVGPALWSRFKNINLLNTIEGGNTTFMVDKDELTGKITQNINDTKKVWSELRKEINGESFIIRKLNEKELRYYWSIISFDIDEPLLIVETKDHKYILDILSDSLKLMWLDEVPQ